MPHERLVEVVTRKTGIELSRGGLREALDRYGHKRLSELRLSRIEDYITLLDAPDGEELRRLIEIISVPHTWFFRDIEQLEVATELITRQKHDGILKIWVPACATGEDAYSLALICASRGISAQIVGSDLCEEALKIAERGSYSPFSVRALPAAFRSQFRQRGRNFEVSSTIKKAVTFVSHNLLGPPLSAAGGWDLILCRNVFIYFSAATAESCASRLGASLSRTGSAMFGAGELIGASPAGISIYSVKNRVVFRKTSGLTDRGTGNSAEHLDARKAKAPVLPTFIPTKQATEVSTREQAPAPITLAEMQGLPGDLVPHPGELTFAKANQVLSNSSEAPADPRKRMMSGIALYSAGDLERALHELRAASLLDEQLWPAAIYQGMCLESMGHPDLARAEYRHAVQVLESNPESYTVLPDELEGLGQDLLEMARRKSGSPHRFSSPELKSGKAVTDRSRSP